MPLNLGRRIASRMRATHLMRRPQKVGRQAMLGLGSREPPVAASVVSLAAPSHACIPYLGTFSLPHTSRSHHPPGIDTCVRPSTSPEPPMDGRAEGCTAHPTAYVLRRPRTTPHQHARATRHRNPWARCRWTPRPWQPASERERASTYTARHSLRACHTARTQPSDRPPARFKGACQTKPPVCLSI